MSRRSAHTVFFAHPLEDLTHAQRMALYAREMAQGRREAAGALLVTIMERQKVELREIEAVAEIIREYQALTGIAADPH